MSFSCSNRECLLAEKLIQEILSAMDSIKPRGAMENFCVQISNFCSKISSSRL
jgi:hypothetical protein